MKSSFTFFILVFLFAGCSKISDKEYMDKAEISLKQNDITGAVEAYKSLIEEYPESKLAPDALEKLAEIYQNNQVKNLSQVETHKEASNLYRKLYEKYPKSKNAARSLFLSAYILANDPVKDTIEAKKAFTFFLEKFPDNEWADDAKEEIKNLGKSAEEILKKKTVTGK